MLTRAGVQTVHRALCGFPVTEKFFKYFVRDVYNSSVAVWTDSVAASLFRWNENYHARKFRERFRPTSAFLVLRKP